MPRARWKAARAIRVFGAVLAAAVVGCCGGQKKIVEEEVPPLGKAEVISILNSQADLTRTLRAKLDVKVQTSGMRRAESCEGTLMAEYPDRLRIRGRHDLLDYEPFDIGSDGETWFIYSHFEELNEIHIGPTHLLDEYFDPGVPLKPSDIVLALGVGRLEENPPTRELLFTRHPGYYLITEVVTNASGRYVSKRMVVDPALIVITRMETFRPDQGIDMVAEMTYDRVTPGAPLTPSSARIRLLREDAFLLELKLRERRAGVRLPKKAFVIPDTEKIPTVYPHDSP